jgi:hypothetical protein
MKRFLLIFTLLLLATDAFGQCGLFSRIANRRAARISARQSMHSASHHTTTTHQMIVTPPQASSGCGCNCGNCSCSPASNSSAAYYPETTTRIVYAVPSPQEIRQSVRSVPNYPYAVPTRFASGNCPGGVCPVP